ncbi:MAG: hypothetical protein V2A72_07640 [Candidatus Omnitrophota bacterium]
MMNSSETGGFTLTLKNISNNQNTNGNTITWSNVNAGQTQWKVANQYFEITYDELPPEWGLQVYTDNESDGADPKYTGNGNPAGLVKTDNTKTTIPLAWFITGSVISGLQNPVERSDGTGFEGSLWHYVIDKNTPDDPDTDENEGFTNGEDYITAWNQAGIAWHENARSNPVDPKNKNPRNKAYMYFASKFTFAPVGATYTTNKLTFEAFTGVSPFPLVVYSEGGSAEDMAYQHIHQKMDEFFNGDKLRLIESYSNPADYGYGYGEKGGMTYTENQEADALDGMAFTYDNALSIIAFLANPNQGNLARAKILCKSLMWAQDNIGNDGSFRNSYDAKQELKAGYSQPTYDPDFLIKNSGNNAWTIISLMQYYRNSGDTDSTFKAGLLDAAVDAGDFIHNNLYDSTTQKGYYYGFDQNGALQKNKSTECNIAIYAAFAQLYGLTNNDGKWLTRANIAKAFIDTMQRTQSSNSKWLVCGVDTNGVPLTNNVVSDCNLLYVLGKDMLQTQAKYYLNYVTDSTANKLWTNYVTGSGYSDTTNFIGVDFGHYGTTEGADGVWFEGTAQLASVCAYLNTTGNKQKASEYLESLKLAQCSSKYANYKAINAASTVITTGFGGWYYYPFPHVGASAWYIGANRNYNVLWGISLDDPVPAPGYNGSYTSDIPEYLTDYLKNHYAPSGWMGETAFMFVDPKCADNPASGETCYRIHLAANWSGIVWQEPLNQWSGGWDSENNCWIGYDLRTIKKLTFKAKASEDDFWMEIYMGYPGDSCGIIPANGDDTTFILDTEWKTFTIDLEAMDNKESGEPDMLHVANGFTVSLDSYSSVDVYFDDIIYITEE